MGKTFKHNKEFSFKKDKRNPKKQQLTEKSKLDRFKKRPLDLIESEEE